MSSLIIDVFNIADWSFPDRRATTAVMVLTLSHDAAAPSRACVVRSVGNWFDSFDPFDRLTVKGSGQEAHHRQAGMLPTAK